MRFLADECFDRRIASALEQAGADVAYASDVARGAPDADVMAQAALQDRILLTKDKDFGALVFRDAGLVPGIVLVRMDGLTADAVAVVTERILALPEHGRGNFTVMDEDGERLRPLA